jgi:uncharacterized membrane protein YdjX (TVP38/TMEM64 family)
MTDYFILFAVVLAVNLLPAFGPPTWAVLILFVLQRDMPAVPTILIAAIAAALGRYLLALAFRWFGDRLPAKTRANLEALRGAVERNRRNALVALGLFAFSPLPSAQMFEAAGMTGVRLLPFTAAFFAGRICSYAIYVGTAATVRGTSMGDMFRDAITSPLGVTFQILTIVGLVFLARIDWAKRLGGS